MRKYINTNKLRRVAYLSHIDWDWIKQRPQFLAELISEQYCVDYYYLSSTFCNNINKSPDGDIKLYKLVKLPFSGRVSLIKTIQKIINTALIGIKKYDLVWICSPEVLVRVDLNKIKLPIIYDCMDDMIETHAMPIYKSMLLCYEKQLIDKAKYVFVSSNSLRNKMLERGCDEGKLYKLYNATNIKSLLKECKNNTESNVNQEFIITYFGTISKWLDIDTIYRILNDSDMSYVRIKLIGPADIHLKKHPRLEHIPPVPHSMLSMHTKDASMFILPFIINNITISVDPVKLYEYIALHKNIAAIYYPELDRYSDFVNFYNNYEELRDIISKLHHNNTITYDINIADKFVSENTWDSRKNTIISKLNSCI